MPAGRPVMSEPAEHAAVSGFDIERARRLAISSRDVAKLARRLESACDEIAALRESLLKARNYAQSAAHIANAAIGEGSMSEHPYEVYVKTALDQIAESDDVTEREQILADEIVRAIKSGMKCERCGHEYRYHAIGHSECVRYIKGQRCTCTEFVPAYREARDA
jgi:hypothetical protein